MLSYLNPYTDADLPGFFLLLFKRLWLFISGQLPFAGLVSDEIQVIVLSCVALSGALVGTFLVLKKQTMLANALSHTILLGIVVASLLSTSLSLPVLLMAALLTALVTTFLTEFCTHVIKLQEDASIGLIFSLFFALGIVLLTLFSRNVHVGTELVMGNVDALKRGDITLVGVILIETLLLFALFYRGFKITTFDPHLARLFGFSPLFFNYLLMVQTSLTSVGAFRAVGVLMVLSFFVVPTLTARLLTHRLLTLIGVAMGLGVCAAVLGVGLSRHLLTVTGMGFSTGGIVVMVLALFYLVGIVLKRFVDISLVRRYTPALRTAPKTHEENRSIG